jgi:hypothetical protein
MMLLVMSLEDLRSVARATPLKLCWIVLFAIELNDIRLHFLRAAFNVDLPWPPTAAVRSALSFAIAALGLVQRPPAPTSAEAYGRLEEPDDPATPSHPARAPDAAPPGGAEATASLLSQVARRCARARRRRRPPARPPAPAPVWRPTRPHERARLRCDLSPPSGGGS